MELANVKEWILENKFFLFAYLITNLGWITYAFIERFEAYGVILFLSGLAGMLVQKRKKRGKSKVPEVKPWINSLIKISLWIVSFIFIAMPLIVLYLIFTGQTIFYEISLPERVLLGIISLFMCVIGYTLYQVLRYHPEMLKIGAKGIAIDKKMTRRLKILLGTFLVLILIHGLIIIRDDPLHGIVQTAIPILFMISQWKQKNDKN